METNKHQPTNVTYATAVAEPSFASASAASNIHALRKGQKYEKRVIKELQQQASERGVEVLANQWFEYDDGTDERICEVDALLYDKEAVYPIEIKYTWSVGAEQELMGLYVPVISAFMNNRPIKPIIIAHSAGLGMRRPESFTSSEWTVRSDNIPSIWIWRI